MKLLRMEPFTNTEESVVDYEAELRRFAEERSAVSGVGLAPGDEGLKDSTEDDQNRSFMRFTDFLASQRKSKANSASTPEQVRRLKGLESDRRVLGLEEDQMARGYSIKIAA